MISFFFSFLASLAAVHFSERSSHFSLRTFHQAIDSAANSLDFWRQLSKAELLPSSALSSSLWLSLSSRFSLRSSVLSPRAPLLLLWFLLLLLLVVLLLQPLLSLHVMLVVFVLLFFFVGVLFLSSADLTATVMVLHSGRSPQGEGRRKCDTSSTRVDAEVCVCISSQLPLATSLQMISN